MHGHAWSSLRILRYRGSPQVGLDTIGLRYIVCVLHCVPCTSVTLSLMLCFHSCVCTPSPRVTPCSCNGNILTLTLMLCFHSCVCTPSPRVTPCSCNGNILTLTLMLCFHSCVCTPSPRVTPCSCNGNSLTLTLMLCYHRFAIISRAECRHA
jgi:hypothetical protein